MTPPITPPRGIGRRTFIKAAGALPFAGSANAMMARRKFKPGDKPMPVMFIGHASPIMAMQLNQFTQQLRGLGMSTVEPTAIVMISAHWVTESTTAILSSAKHEALHDLTGYPPELYQQTYSAAGNPALAERIKEMLGPYGTLRSDWGLDMGSWPILMHMYPTGDVPVVQLSIDIYKAGAYHLEVGRILASLRDTGVLVIASGNIVHNQQRMDLRAAPGQASHSWAQAFDNAVATAVNEQDYDNLVNYHWMEGYQYAVPTPEHYWPLLYAVGASRGDKARTLHAGFQYGTVSLRSIQFG